MDFAAEAAGGHSDVLRHFVGYEGFVVCFRSGLYVYEGRLFVAAKSMVNVVLLMTYVVVGRLPFWPRSGARGVSRIEPSILADSLIATGIVGNEGLG